MTKTVLYKLIIRFFLFTKTKDEVQDHAEDGSTCNSGDAYAKEVDVATKSIADTDADGHDAGDHRNVLGIKHVAFFIDQDGNTLCSNSTKKIDLKAADNSQGNAVNDADKGREARDDHGQNARHDHDRYRKNLCNGHG